MSHDDKDPTPHVSDSVASTFRLLGLDVPPRHIGPYRLLDVLGEGGMGVVYLAQQEQPVRRKVALKIIKLGMDTVDVLGRFEAERQALALMNHPNIAKVFDARTTENGRPYFVMEHIPGEPINEYCDRHRLSTRERLELIIPVCQAIQHAHQNAIIHRDIKPSNVLVTIQDGKPVPKVIDFGVAKAVEHRLTERTIFTERGQLIGTPEYMSPEQSEMTGLNIDTRTDVYALGVMLYELISGTLPFERKELREAGLQGIQRLIREVDPPKPSTRVSQMGNAAAAIAERRGTKTQRLVSQIRGDLDWIVMRALEKDRSRRYASPLDLAADIQRHLRDEPVLAGPPSTVYRVRKFVRRHRVGVGTAVAAVIVLLGFAVTMTVLAARIARERDRAERARTDLESVVSFQSGMLSGVDPAQMGERMLADLTKRVQSSGRENGLTEAQVARVTSALDDLLKGVNPTDAALQVLENEILVPAVDQVDARFQSQPLVAAQLFTTLGQVYQSFSMYKESEGQFQRALHKYQDLLGERDSRTLTAKANLAGVFYSMGKYAEGEGLVKEVRAATADSLGEASQQVVDLDGFLALFYTEEEKYDLAEPLERQVHQRTLETLGPDHPSTLSTRHNLGMLLLRMNKLDEAEALLSDNFTRIVRLKGRDEGVGAANMLAGVLTALGRYDAAESLYVENLAISRRLNGEDARATIMALGNLGGTYLAAGRPKDAEPYLVGFLERARKVLGENHPNILVGLGYVAEAYKELGRYDEAEKALREILQKKAADGRRTHPNALYKLACIRALRGDSGEALVFLARAVDEGFADGEEMNETADLASIRGDPRFPGLLAGAQENARTDGAD